MVDSNLEFTPLSPEDEQKAAEQFAATGIRTWLVSTYYVGAYHYSTGGEPSHKRRSLSPVRWANEIGCLLWLGLTETHSGRNKKVKIDVDALVTKWHGMILGLSVAHDKDEADKWEAKVDECLSPILKAPVAQLREFAPKLRDSPKSDLAVPYLVWHGMEIWIDKVVLLAPDEEIKELKTNLAREIVEMVEDDAKRDLPAAMVRALQWRSPQKLEEVRSVVAIEKAARRPVRLRGRESCLFLEAGGTDDEPKVCVQI